MGYALDKVLAEYSKIDVEAPTMTIPREKADDAIKTLHELRIHRKKDIFLYLSSINLLNAAIKQADYKKYLRYSFIKGKALLAAKIIITRYRYNDVLYFYDTEEKCLYVEIYGVVFSFHNIIEEPLIIEKAATAERIEWPGIRLQKIAEPLFDLAKTMWDSR